MVRATDALTDVHGAVYVPARAFNAYQCWAEYDPTIVERDVGFAASLSLNALRVFLSYERWREAPTALGESFDHLLATAASHSIRVLPILFESAGAEPTPERLRDHDPATACAVRSPSHAVVRNPRHGRVRGAVRRLLGGRSTDDWADAAAFVAWVADRYGDDDRVLALELMNEPGGWSRRVAFARAMLRTADRHRGDVPLTMGCKSLANNRAYDDPELDVYQFHDNLPATATDVATTLERAATVAADAGRPVWLTEWQRTLVDPPDTRRPDYASLAETIRASDVDGEFFWSLMVKPAYLPAARRAGRVNGVFHEDGAVWSRADLRALARTSVPTATERPRLPAWADPT